MSAVSSQETRSVTHLMMSRSRSARHLVTTHTSDDEEEVSHTQEEEAGGTEAQQLDLAEYNFGENNHSSL